MNQSSIVHYRSSIPKGFTLIEVLVALGLVATIAMLVYGSFTAASRAVDLYRDRLACSTRTSLVLRRMTRQLRCAYLPPAAGATPAGPAASGGDPALLGPGAAPPLSPPQAAVVAETLSPAAAFRTEMHAGGGTTLSFLTTAGPAPDQPTPLARVRYRHDPAAGVLSFVSEPYLPGAAAPPEPAPGHTILTGVQRLDVQLYDGRTWQSRWDRSNGPALPRAVRLILTVADDRQRVHEFRTQVAVAGRRMPPRHTSVAAGERP